MEFEEKSLETIYVPEPELRFRYSQKTDYPKDGLFLYGPVETELRQTISVGVVGTDSGLSFFRTWVADMNDGIKVAPPTAREKKTDRLHLSDFPGLEETFGIRLDPKALVEYALDGREIEIATKTANLHEAVSKTVDLFLAPVTHHDKNEERLIDVWVFVLPEIIFERCKSKARRTGVALSPGEYAKKQKKRSDLPLFDGVIDFSAEGIFDDIPDFHRLVKAKMLHAGFPSQLVRETTLAPDRFLNKAGWPTRRTQDRAIVAWNFATGLYYKSQPEPPWSIAQMRPGVCYVGLVFKLIPNHPCEHACCAAQMFLSEGDGVVFRGANGPWRTAGKEFHLKNGAAKKLIEKVLNTYKSKFNQYPSELFIHGRTAFNHEEWAEFEAAAPPETNIVGVRIKQAHGEMKLFRDGDFPCLRGTAILLDETNAYLWASGYLSRLGTYIGPETPNPLSVTVLRSTGEIPNIRDVLRDIMGLTKINYNACNFSDGLPVTIRFADKVGDILVMGSAQGAERQPFKFYI